MAWMTRPRSKDRVEAEARAPAKPKRSSVPREYLPLHDYLDNRFAHTVVLRFAEIEDLLGFTLPDLARVQREWWTNADADGTPSPQSRSWIQASRTAEPNLPARTVAFERVTA